MIGNHLLGRIDESRNDVDFGGKSRNCDTSIQVDEVDMR